MVVRSKRSRDSYTKHFLKQEYKLTGVFGTMLRFAGVVCEVTDFCVFPEKAETGTISITHASQKLDQSSYKDCRICYGDYNTAENPILCPCSCTGTAGGIHLNCLKQWLQTKLDVKKENNIVTYTWKAFNCELCKTALPCMIYWTHL